MAPNWGVIGDEVECWTQPHCVKPLRKTRKGNNMSKLRLDVKADVTVITLPSHLSDEEDLEDHYMVMLMEDDDVGQTAEVVELASKLEIDLCLDEQDTKNTRRVMETLADELSTLIRVPPGSEALLSAAATILQEASAAATDGRRKCGNNNNNNNAVRVHLKASIRIDVVAEMANDDVEPAFVPASKASIEKLERVRVEGPSASLCSICREEIAAGSEAVRMPCNHFYHENCVVGWLQTSRACPECRSSLPSDDP